LEDPLEQNLTSPNSTSQPLNSSSEHTETLTSNTTNTTNYTSNSSSSNSTTEAALEPDREPLLPENLTSTNLTGHDENETMTLGSNSSEMNTTVGQNLISVEN